MVGLVQAAAGVSKTATAHADAYLVKTPLQTDLKHSPRGCVRYAYRIVP